MLIWLLRNLIRRSTYMQQVRLFIAGERDYSQIHGDTGPLV
jgi:hypothetical protein